MVSKSYYKWNQDVNLKKLVQYQGKIENFRTMSNSSYGDSINYCISIDQSGVGELVELDSKTELKKQFTNSLIYSNLKFKVISTVKKLKKKLQ